MKKTSWICVFVAQDAPSQSLRYLRRACSENSSRDELSTWAAESCNYFDKQQLCSGAITYMYEPVRDEQMQERASILRACGCLYSLSKAAEVLGNNTRARPLAVAVRLATYLLGKSSYWEPGYRVIKDSDSSQYPKVGSTALMVLALSFSRLQETFAVVAPELRASLYRLQQANGRFLTHFGRRHESPGAVEFYPGQVLLVLAMDTERGSAAAADICAAAFAPYRSHFSTSPTTAFVGWQIEAWSRLAMVQKNAQYAMFAFEQADWLLERQIARSSDIPELIGGFAKRREIPGFSTIVYVEALISALKLAAFVNDTHRLRRYAAAIRIGLSFCNRLRLMNTPSSFYRNPEKCVGGVAMRFDNMNVRCDVVQHFLTMALAAHESFDIIHSQ